MDKAKTIIVARLRHGIPPTRHDVQIYTDTGEIVGGSARHNGPVFHYLLAAARNFRDKNLTE